jgi:2Fe-2S ferredoxin
VSELTGSDGYQVRVEPLGMTVVCRPGERLMRAAQRAGFRWPTLCGGDALCGVCYVRVTQSEGELPALSAKEADGLKLVSPHLRKPNVRLACQLPVLQDMTVERIGVVAP